MNEVTNHCVDAIRRDHEALTAQQQKHVQECNGCRTELEIMQQLTTAISQMPTHRAPSRLKYLVLAGIRKPGYRIWHLFATAMALLVSPLLVETLNVGLTDNMSLFIQVFCSALGGTLFIPVAYELSQRYTQRLDRLMDYIDRAA